MSTAELKIDLINQIAKINDKLQLEELLEWLDFQNSESEYVTSLKEKNAIVKAKEQIKKGEVVSNADVQKDISNCLYKLL